MAGTAESDSAESNMLYLIFQRYFLHVNYSFMKFMTMLFLILAQMRVLKHCCIEVKSVKNIFLRFLNLQKCIDSALSMTMQR